MPTATKIRTVWPDSAEPRATLERETPGGRVSSRPLGPRALLGLGEAAVVLKRPRGEVQQAIRTGFLTARRRGNRCYVTMKACTDFLREEEADWAFVRARAHEPTIPADEVLRRHGD